MRNPPTSDQLAATAVETCQAAAAHVRERVALGPGASSPVATKSTFTDVVTETDRSTEALIRARLTTETPGARVLGEEEGTGVLGQGPFGAIEWVIDPIDGTVNFTYGLPTSAVSVAAVVGGRPVAGAVIDLGSGDLFVAEAGAGATLNGAPVRCRSAGGLAMALVATGYSYSPELRRSHGRAIATLIGDVRDVRCFGSAALHLCWVACGRVDAYVERDIKPWDYAAGALIAREAGARVELPCPENADLVLAAHPELFPQLRGHFEPSAAVGVPAKHT